MWRGHFSFPLFSPCYSNGVVLEDGDKYSLNEDGSELLIKHVSKVDEGDYTCIAKNKAGEKTEEVSLSVFGKKMTPFADGLLSIKNTAAGFFVSSLTFLCCTLWHLLHTLTQLFLTQLWNIKCSISLWGNYVVLWLCYNSVGYETTLYSLPQ